MSEERLARIEAQMAALEARLARLEGGIAMPAETSPADADEERLRAVVAAVSDSGSFLSLAGRAFLILGGAFLVRAVTESGWLPTPAGIVVGIAYAALWLVLADRSGARARGAEATTFAALSVVCCMPLAWEAAARFAVVPAAVSVALVVAFALAAFGVAERRGLRASTWITAVVALAALAALTLSTHALMATAIGTLVLGVAAAWLGYGRRGWKALRWPMAIAADVAVLLSILLVTREGGAPPSYTDLSLAGVWVLAVALAASYLGSFTLRTLIVGQDIGLFVAVQGFVSAWIGLGGAASVARVAGRGLAATGTIAMLVAVATYAAAIVLLERRPGLRRSFRFTTSLALLLLVWGSTLLTAGQPLALTLGGLSIVAAALSMRFGRASLAVHAGLLAFATGIASGLHGAAVVAFLGAPEQLATVGGPSLVPASVAAVATYALIWRGGDTARFSRRIASVLAAAVAVVALAVFLIAIVAPTAQLTTSPQALALLRVAVLSGAAVLIAALRRFDPFAPLAGVPLAALVAAALELALGLARQARPASLFAGFALFGLALLAVARLGRRPAERP